MERRINLISKEVKNDAGEIVQQSNIVMRVSASRALELLGTGTFMTTTKGKLRSYLNKSNKLLHNKRTVDNANFHKEITELKNLKDPFSGKTYVAIHRRYAETPQLLVASYRSL